MNPPKGQVLTFEMQPLDSDALVRFWFLPATKPFPFDSFIKLTNKKPRHKVGAFCW